MTSMIKALIKQVSLLLLSGGLAASAHAHLMMDQQGTLNFLDDSVYMVLSLPASTFAGADEDHDGELSLTEFSTHRASLISAVKEHITLSAGKNQLPLHNILVSPVTPHDAPKEPARHVVIMGRFSLQGSEEELSFHVGLYAKLPDDQSLKITANRKSESQKQVFTLTPDTTVGKLSFN